MFRSYMHVERYGTTAVLGIELGKCYVFPKLDGTNASVWKRNGLLQGGSRTRELRLDKDNAGFYSFVCDSGELLDFFSKYAHLRLYGEWLVPHTLKTYREDAWRRFYIFDVYNDKTEQYLSYDEYKPLVEEFGLDYIPPLAIIKNGSYENFIHVLNQNNFFIKDGEGLGEGIVLKNYDFYNSFGQQVWAKIVSSEFKEKHYSTMGPPETEHIPIEEKIAEEFCTTALCQKTYNKIRVEHGDWSSKLIPQLLGRIEYDLITEEIWNILRTHGNPTINFKTLKHFIIAKVKQSLPEVF